MSFAVLFLAAILCAVLINKLPVAIFVLYFIASLAAFFTYASDKSAARRDQWRTKESTLHFLAVMGGWPGALIAQKLLRHKSRKRSFQIVFWATVVLNCGALIASTALP